MNKCAKKKWIYEKNCEKKFTIQLFRLNYTCIYIIITTVRYMNQSDFVFFCTRTQFPQPGSRIRLSFSTSTLQMTYVDQF